MCITSFIGVAYEKKYENMIYGGTTVESKNIDTNIFCTIEQMGLINYFQQLYQDSLIVD